MLRLPKSVVISVAAVAFGAVATLCGAQTGGSPTPGASTRTPAAPKPFTPKRLPWGDPDISGNFTNLYEVGTPFERPDTLAGRKLEDVKGEELAAILGTIVAAVEGDDRRPAVHVPPERHYVALCIGKREVGEFVPRLQVGSHGCPRQV